MVMVSTIIPTKGRDTLRSRTVPSVLAQTFSDWECIVVGDGFLPDPFDDPRIRTVATPKSSSEWKVAGVAAWNHGLSLATGEWVSYLADDDAYSPWHHELLLEVAAEADFVYGQSLIRHPDGTPTDRKFGHTDEAEAHDIAQGSYLMRRTLDPWGDLDVGDEAWDARMLRRVLATHPRIRRVWAIVHDYYPAPENRAFHRLP